MSDKRSVVSVRDGGTYYIKKSCGTHFVTKDDSSSWILPRENSVGTAKSFDDALAIVRSDSGKPIKTID